MGQPTARLLVTAFGPPATAALKQLVTAAKAGDLVAPVDVVVPSSVASVTVRRQLADPGLVNVRFSSLPQLADRLAARHMALAGVTPIAAAARSLAVRTAIRTGSGRLADAGAHPRTADLIESVLSELDDAEASKDHLERLAETSARGAEVAALYRAYREQLAGHATPAEVLDAARAAVDAGEAPESSVILFAPRRLAAAERRLMDALDRAGSLRAVICMTGDEEADRDAQELLAWLESRLEPVRHDVGHGEQETSLVLAPDAEEEVRLAVRRVLAFFAQHESTRGKRPERVAIAYRSRVPYARLLDEQLTAAGLPFHVSSQRTLAESVAGHALLHLLDLRTEDYARAEVLDWLADAPIRDSAGRNVPAARWDRLSRDAGVSRSHRLWRDRLDHHAQGIADGRADVADDDEHAEARRERYDRRIADCHALAAFVDEVADACESVAGATTWAGVSKALRSTLLRFLGATMHIDHWGRATDAARWVSVEQSAYDGVLAAVAAMAALDTADGPAPTYDLVRQAVATELDRGLPSGTTLGRGVTVAALRDVAGADLDLLIVLGMTETSFPPTLREHPILRDVERSAAGCGLLTLADRRRTDRRDYLAAVASARTVVLSTPRADTRAQRALHPSPWWMATAAKLHGGPLRVQQLATLNAPWLVRHDSFVTSLMDADRHVSESEYDVALALGGHGDAVAAIDSRYARARGAVIARRDGTFGPWTGRVDPLDDALRASVDARLSATSLQQWAMCPLSFFLKRVLGVRELEAPDEEESVNPAVKGSLVHEVLERFFRETLAAADGPSGRDPAEAWTTAEIARAHELLDVAADELQASGRTGRPLLWQAQRTRLHRQLTRILSVDSVLRAQRRARPIALEDSFGRGSEPPLELHLERSGTVALAGSIDRVDRTDAGGLVVTDYKTGKDSSYDRIPQVGKRESTGSDLVDRGRKLQLVLYGLAARQRHGGPQTPVESYYWFVEQGSLHRGAEIGSEAERRLLDVVDVTVQGIRNGVYPAHPGAEGYFGWESCGFCAYDRVCSTARGEQWEHLKTDEDVRPYADLADPPPVEPEADA